MVFSPDVTRRTIPSIDSARAAARRAGARGPVRACRGRGGAARSCGRSARERLRGDDSATEADTIATTIEERTGVMLQLTFRPSLRRVINATGVIIHTNLGRRRSATRPFGASVSSRGYPILEYDVAAGRRGARDTHAEALLRRLTGAESAVVVNNCAAATMLALAALARGREA